MIKTEKLPTEFIGTGQVKGIKFTQIKASNKAYIYEVNNNGAIYFEVFKIISSGKCIDFNKRTYSETEFKESYPKARLFGTDAFNCFTLEKANVYFEQFNQADSLKSE